MGNRKNKHYDEALKLEVVKRYLAGESTSLLVKEYEISDAKRIYLWVKKYQKGETLGEVRGKSSLQTGVIKGRKRKKEESIEEENTRLRMENEILKKLLSCLPKKG